MHPHKHRFAVLGLSVLSLALLAGCAGLDDSDAQTTGKNRNPEAVINASDKVVMTGETVTFDAKGSEDEDGEIVSYSYSFGDGTTAEGADEDAPVTHTYATGGEYIVTLTVTDDGNDRAGALTDTATVEITVNQEFPVATTVVAADPVESDEMNQTFMVYKSADRFELDLEVQGSLVTGSSEIEIRVTDTEGDVIPGATQTVTVDGTDTESVDLNGLLTDEGAHHVEVLAKSGGASVSGTLKVFYGAEEV
jgi:PKD repeat protein